MAGNLVSSQPHGPPTEQQVQITPFLGRDAAFAPPEPREEGVNWGRYLSALRRYRWLMLAIVLTGSGAGVAVTRLIPPDFNATTTVWVESGDPARAGPLRTNELLDATGWVQLLQTPLVYDPVVHKLRLYIEPDLLRDSMAFTTFDVSERFRTGQYTLELGEGVRQWTLRRRDTEIERGAVGDSIGRQLGWRWAPTAQQLRGGKRDIEFDLKDPRQVVTELNSNLRATMPEDGSFLKLTLSSKDRYRVAEVVNAISAEFVDIAADLKKRKLTELRVALDSQVAIAYQNLRNAESQLKNFQISTITAQRAGGPIAPGLASTTNQVTGSYFQQRVQQDRIKQDREQLEAVLARARAGAITVDAFQTIPSVNQAPQLKQSLADLTVREADLSALLQRYTPEHPVVLRAQTQIDLLRSQYIPQYAQALVDQLKLQEADLAVRIGAAATELREIPEVTITESRLTREMSAADALYKMLAQRLEEAKLSELSAIPDVRVLDPAVPPRRPASDSAPKIIMMAIAGSIGLAIGLALLLDQLDKRFRYPEQVSTELGLPILGAIPAIKKSRRGELGPEQAAQVVEAFRTIRLNLAHSYGAGGPVALTISSPGPGDGKSLVSSNLAVSFAEAGYRTVLIDGDIRRGEIHRMFGVDRRPGLLDCLTAGATYDQIIRPTSQRNLWVIACGTRRHQGPELLGSAAMADLMAHLKSQFNVVIVDSPPLGAGIDPFVLGTTTGHMMMVFRTGETDRQMAEAKLRLLDRLPVRVLGAVLNEIQAEGVYRYYSYLYGYTTDEEPAQIAAQSEGVANSAG